MMTSLWTKDGKDDEWLSNRYFNNDEGSRMMFYILFTFYTISKLANNRKMKDKGICRLGKKR
jgi:hypothetical protein